MRIAHLTSAHPRSDLRIFSKQCGALVAEGHEVTLFVADGKGNARHDGIEIVDVGRASGRLDRLIFSARRVAQRAAEGGFDICQLHDPELLVHRRRLQASGARVIYDAHEDLPCQILSKPYLPGWARGAIAALARRYLARVFVRLDGVITATEHIASTVPAAQERVLVLRNYPFAPPPLAPAEAQKTVSNKLVYAGGISELRGVADLVEALSLTRADVELALFGNPVPAAFLDHLQALPGWEKVHYHGYVPHAQVSAALAEALGGIVVLHPTEAYRQALPVKMFEYMAAGVPVIASDFPLWERIVRETGCGRTVAPRDPQALAREIDWLVEHPQEARSMGARGAAAVRSSLNWQSEARRLAVFVRTFAAIGAGE